MSDCRQTVADDVPMVENMSTSLAITPGHSGPVEFTYWYQFGDGGPVEAGKLPYPEQHPAPFEVARWTVAPGTANDLDVHRSRELWLVIAGAARAEWADGHTQELHPGDVVAFESLTPHQLINDGSVPFVAASVYWIDR
jgi:mannose-6-phosphate isomerase-like protein (cupin superfamily)